MDNLSKLQTYTPKERNMYLLGMFGQNMIYNIIATGLTFYFQSVIFVPAIATSIIFAVARVWDAINDPMMGTIVDKTKNKYGKCRPYLIACPSIIMIITILCFTNGIYSSSNSSTVNTLIVAWAGISYILWGMSYTVGDIPLWGITSLMTEKESDRSKILSLARISAGLAGGVVLLMIIPLSQKIGQLLENVISNPLKSQQVGFIIVAVVLTVIGCALFQLTGIFVKERVKSSEKRYTMKENFKLMWSNKPFRQILVSSVLRAPIMLLMSVAMTLLSYYYGNYWNDYLLYMIILGGAIFGGQFIAMALVPMMIKKYEKKALYNVSALASAVAFVLVFVVYKIAPTQLDKPLWLAVLFLVFLIAGAGLGALTVLQSVMIADAVDYEEYHNGIRPDGVFFSGQSFATKLSSGISAIIQGVVFAAVAFSGDGVAKINEALRNGAVFKTDFPEVATAMFFLCSIPPAIGLLLSVIPTWKYAMSDKEHQKMLDELHDRRVAAGKAEEEKAEVEAK